MRFLNEFFFYFRYGDAMTDFLPIGGYRMIEAQHLNLFKKWDLSDAADTGYVVEADFIIPPHLHDQMNDLPLLVERMKLDGVFKLTANLFDKIKYVAHYRIIKQALSFGVEMTKVHRVFAFSQSDWMKPYVELCIELRKNSTSKVEKEIAKLLINAVFGEKKIECSIFLFNSI